MQKITRRKFTKTGLTLAASAGLLSSCSSSRSRIKVSRDGDSTTRIGSRNPSVEARVVIVGGGLAGATCAKHIRAMAPDVDVTLVERSREYHTLTGSNLALSQGKQSTDLVHGYEVLRDKYGVNVVHLEAREVDSKQVTLTDGSRLNFDRAVIAPGVGWREEQLLGYQAEDQQRAPHAWQSGRQVQDLHRQLAAIPDDGLIIICPPPSPYRHPPAVYERAGLAAHYLKNNKNKARVLILDQADEFPKQAEFQRGWQQHYQNILEWRGAGAGGTPLEIDTRAMRVNTGAGWESADLINLIPAQQAGAVAQVSGLADRSGWCPIEPRTFLSKRVDNVHVIGDACRAGDMPKSGFSAIAQAKVAAAAIVDELSRGDRLSLSLDHTCYALVAPDYGVAIPEAYRLSKDGEIVKLTEADSAGGAGAETPTLAAARAHEWYAEAVQEAFG